MNKGAIQAKSVGKLSQADPAIRLSFIDWLRLCWSGDTVFNLCCQHPGACVGPRCWCPGLDWAGHVEKIKIDGRPWCSCKDCNTFLK